MIKQMEKNNLLESQTWVWDAKYFRILLFVYKSINIFYINISSKEIVLNFVLKDIPWSFWLFEQLLNFRDFFIIFKWGGVKDRNKEWN